VLQTWCFEIRLVLPADSSPVLDLLVKRLPDLDSIYTDAWKQRLSDYFARGNQFAAAGRYWAFDFERQWRKHRTAILRELCLVRRLSRWMPPLGRRVLVMGSWLGAEAIAYALCGAEVTAIDLDEQALALSEELAAAYGVRIHAQKLDAAATGLATESFDLVSCSQVLEHLPPADQPKLLGEMWRVCRPGGLLWLDTPNQLNPRDQHDTGLYFVHWLPRPLKTALARVLGRDVPTREPAFGYEPVGLHYYLSYFRLSAWLGDLGPCELLSRYRGFADVDHYAQERRLEGRAGGIWFGMKLTAMRAIMPWWNFNWFADIRLVIRKG
jgi:2-polyprenyl-3-methyl-5-hydroxy-6-metoxy-1,4-benzoquinol methylase